jgi:hypothetical protein
MNILQNSKYFPLTFETKHFAIMKEDKTQSKFKQLDSLFNEPKDLDEAEKQLRLQILGFEKVQARAKARNVDTYSRNLQTTVCFLKWYSVVVLIIVLVLIILNGFKNQLDTPILEVHHLVITALIGAGIAPILTLVVKLLRDKE